MKNQSTPRWLQLQVAAIWIAALLFAIVALTGVRARREAVKAIGKDSVPSIIAAQKLKVSLSDLDANVVNDLISPPGQNANSLKGYVARRQEITDSLIVAAENITFGDLERKPIRDLTNALSAYERLAIKARTLNLRREQSGAVSTYRDALRQLQEQLLPAADALAKANEDALHRREAELRLSGQLLVAGTLITGGLLLGSLIATQIFLSRRMQRTFSPTLLASTLLAAILLVATLRAHQVAQESVRSARDDAFASLSALWKARAFAYDSNSDESRWLFDQQQRPVLEKAFFEKNALLLRLPTSQSQDAIFQATQSGPLPQGTKGFFADELGNITFVGEKEAAEETVHAFGSYYLADKTIRELATGGRQDEAVRFCLGTQEGQSNWAFARFDAALEKTIQINQKGFDDAVDRGFSGLKGLDAEIPLAVLAVSVLAFLGIRPRLREYGA